MYKMENKSNVQCYYCKKHENYEGECWKKKSYLNKGRVNASSIKDETSKSMFINAKFLKNIKTRMASVYW